MIAEIRNKLDKYLNNLKIKKKLFLLYFYCVMLPLVLTDAVILGITIRDEYDAQQEMLRNAVSSVMSFSYTHLDVYKRQEEDAAMITVEKSFSGASVSITCLLYTSRILARLNPKGMEP